MRLDRFITLNMVQPFHRTRTARHASRLMPLPVLMYHSISDDPETGAHPYYRVCTGPTRFREQMQWLKDNGYRGVTLNEGLKSEIRNQKSEIKTKASSENSAFSFQLSAFEPRPVVITFDDGFQDFYTIAWPILREFGFTATMYLPTAFIGSCHPSLVTRHSFNGRACLTWDEVEELHCAGIEFGSHTVNHPKLVELPWKQVELEIQSSKLEIETRLGVHCAAFSYPYAFPQTDGDFVDRLKNLLQAGGYETCVTTQLGRHQSGDDVLQIKRLPVNSGDDVGLFQAKLEGDYDWLAPLQSGVKKIKSALSLKRNPNHVAPGIGQVSVVK